MLVTEKPRCPACDQVLFNRLHDNCMFCGKLLPEALRLTASEKTELRRTKQEQQEKAGREERPKFVKEFYRAHYLGEDQEGSVA